MTTNQIEDECRDGVILEHYTDEDHVGHDTEFSECIPDNTVEVTYHWYCNDCQCQFIKESVTIVSAPWMNDE